MTIAGASETLTVLFTDLVGSTELSTRLGQSVYDDVRRDHFAALRDAVKAHQGELLKTTGDGIIAVFGSAVEGVRCAVAMQQATDWQGRTRPGPLVLRVGVALGEIVREDGDAYGLPVVEAARLVSRADGGQILATALVRAVAGTWTDVEFVAVGPVELKGLPEPVMVYEVDWRHLPAGLPLPPLGSALRSFAFVGRDSEVAQLRDLWATVRIGQREVVLIGGEPGVGKTRLAAEFAASVHHEGAVVLGGRCDEGLGLPYQPFVEALRHLIAHTPAVRLGRQLGRLAGELTRLVPELGDVVPGLPPPLRSDPETERYRLFDAVAAWLAALSKTGPGVLVIDDLQWAARPTLLMLRHVVRSPDPMRLLVVGTFRDTELGGDHPVSELLADLHRDGVARMTLSGLDADGVAAIVEAAAGRGLSDDDRAVARAIHAETQGNPFFVGEVLHHLEETGGHRAFDKLGIPEGVREVVGRRLGRLSGPTNSMLSLAAVVGEEFETEVVRAAGDFDDETFLSALEEATAARLLGETAWPDLRYRFGHAIVRATIYDEMSAARRAQLHRRVGAALEQVHRDDLDGHLPALSHHFTVASATGDAAPAVRYTTLAGNQALAQLAHDDAVGYYRHALGMLDRLDDASAPTGRVRRCELLISLGEAQRRAGDRAHRETLLGAARLAEELANPDLLTRAALANHRGFFSIANDVDDERVAALEAALAALDPADSALRARLLVTLASELVFSADHERRHRLAAEGLEMGRRVGDPTTLGDVLALGYVPIFTTLDIAALRRHTDELGAVARRLGDPALEFWGPTWGFMTACLVGDGTAAQQLITEAARAAKNSGQPFTQWIATFGRSHWSRIVGWLDEAEALAWESLELARAAGAPDSFRMFGIQLFWIRFDQGRLDEVVDLFAKAIGRDRVPALTLAAYCLTLCELDRLDEARPLFDELAAAGYPIPFAWLFGATMLAEAAAALGDRDEAQVLYDRLAPHSLLMATNGAATTGPVAHYLGLLAATLERHDDADAHFREALQLEERIGAPAWMARTRLEAARSLLARSERGDEQRARELLDQSLATATELGLGAVERRGGPLLSRLRSGRSPSKD